MEKFSIVAHYNTVDIALWFKKHMAENHERTQPYKIHALMYFAQGTFASINHGRMLMPIEFIICQGQIIAPNIDVLLEYPRNNYIINLAPEVENFLMRVWSRYGALSASYLKRKYEQHPFILQALRHGERTLIPHQYIAEYFLSLHDEDYEYIQTSDGRLLPKWVPSSSKNLP